MENSFSQGTDVHNLVSIDGKQRAGVIAKNGCCGSRLCKTFGLKSWKLSHLILVKLADQVLMGMPLGERLQSLGHFCSNISLSLLIFLILTLRWACTVITTNYICVVLASLDHVGNWLLAFFAIARFFVV
ncbi:hypothetical protein DM01DRAFT_301848 [Hesseltinella vesiculosa]|uniref:Uncharacterized protein n=1 Tax=Hesseltinella vesiculosa TaxID=101127 RepID=A0A1X2G9B0_9FUNG|nr:hypothetical protein DM01DRAFT_301848 [Hesseltinella vesiculosa]